MSRNSHLSFPECPNGQKSSCRILSSIKCIPQSIDVVVGLNLANFINVHMCFKALLQPSEYLSLHLAVRLKGKPLHQT